jgi:hypothetical protein
MTKWEKKSLTENLSKTAWKTHTKCLHIFFSEYVDLISQIRFLESACLSMQIILRVDISTVVFFVLFCFVLFYKHKFGVRNLKESKAGNLSARVNGFWGRWEVSKGIFWLDSQKQTFAEENSPEEVTWIPQEKGTRSWPRPWCGQLERLWLETTWIWSSDSWRFHSVTLLGPIWPAVSSSPGRAGCPRTYSWKKACSQQHQLRAENHRLLCWKDSNPPSATLSRIPDYLWDMFWEGGDFSEPGVTSYPFWTCYKMQMAHFRLRAHPCFYLSHSLLLGNWLNLRKGKLVSWGGPSLEQSPCAS